MYCQQVLKVFGFDMLDQCKLVKRLIIAMNTSKRWLFAALVLGVLVDAALVSVRPSAVVAAETVFRWKKI